MVFMSAGRADGRADEEHDPTADGHDDAAGRVCAALPAAVAAHHGQQNARCVPSAAACRPVSEVAQHCVTKCPSMTLEAMRASI